MFISDVERCENIMLTLVKRSMERYNGSFITRFIYNMAGNYYVSINLFIYSRNST